MLIPEAVSKRLRVVEGGRLEAPNDSQYRSVALNAATGQEQILVLDYSFPLSESVNGKPAEMPLIRPQTQAQGEARVRIWDDAGPFPVLVGDLWIEQPIEEVVGKRGLPVLVLSSNSLSSVLSLRLGDARPAPVTVFMERALIRAQITENGTSYRASYLIGRLAKRTLDLELPAPVSTLNLRITLDGLSLPVQTLDDFGQPSDLGRIARLRLSPEIARKNSILDVSYQVTAPRIGFLRAVLRQPILKGDSGRVPVRWLVSLPPSWLTITPESGEPHTWSRQGWLLAPRPDLTNADMERWFAAGSDVPPDESDNESPAYARSNFGGEILTLTIVPRHTWIAAGSLLIVTLGLSTYLLMRSTISVRIPIVISTGAIIMLILAAACILFWPDLSALIAYACEPGVAVLIFASIVQWMLHVRYRNQLLFLPSFSRSRQGSSLVRNNSRPTAPEPSTVDAPRIGGSKWPGQGM